MFYKYQIKYWNWGLKILNKTICKKEQSPNVWLILVVIKIGKTYSIVWGKKDYTLEFVQSPLVKALDYIFSGKKNSCGKWNIILWEVTHYLLLKEIKILFKKPLEERKNHNMIYVHIFCIILFLCVYVNSFGYLKILLRRLH